MHKEIANFILFVKGQFWEFFQNRVLVLDIGSGDYNGNNRQFFDISCSYQGNDVFPGRNVDLVYKTSELPFYKPTFDTIITTECFQHDPEYMQSLLKIITILRPGGLFVGSCATTGREEHGTKKSLPMQSFGTRGGLSKWKTYYKNLTFDEINAVIPFEKHFCAYRVYVNTSSNDLFFWGIKKGISFTIPIVDFVGPYVERIAPLVPVEQPKLVELKLVSKHEPKNEPKLPLKKITEYSGIESVGYNELTEDEKRIVDTILKQSK
jgi:SAM-dependent methyltransferase